VVHSFAHHNRIQFGYIFPLALDHIGYVRSNHNCNSDLMGLLHCCKDWWCSQVSHQKHKNVLRGGDEYEQRVVLDVQNDGSGWGCNDVDKMVDHNDDNDSNVVGLDYDIRILGGRFSHGKGDNDGRYIKPVPRIDVGKNCGIHWRSL